MENLVSVKVQIGGSEIAAHKITQITIEQRHNWHSSFELRVNLDDVLGGSNKSGYVGDHQNYIGKDVYITAKPSTPDEKNQIIYKVHLISSPAKLSTESAFFKGLGKIEEMQVSETYNYMAGKSSDFEKISALLETARINFPDATLVAFKNGRKIKLEKAIKKLPN